MVKIIGLAGKSGSGKDLIADFMCREYGYRKIAVADPIRDEVAHFVRTALTLGAERFALPSHFSVVVDAFEAAVRNKPTSPEERILQQWWGTEWRRNSDPEYWTKILGERLATEESIVVSDVRLIQEIDVIRKAGGEVWYIERPGLNHTVGIAGHSTENGIIAAMCDRCIVNDGSIHEVTGKIARFANAKTTSTVVGRSVAFNLTRW